MNFSTFGPFVLTQPWESTVDDFYKSLREADSKLDKGIGVYIVACRDKDGHLIPWYVGRTHSSFGDRLYHHFKHGKFAALIKQHKSIEIFLLARVTGKGKMVRSTEKTRANGLKSIKFLEFTLIGSCVTKNAKLLNKQENVFHSAMHVPGFWNSSVENYDDAAHQLASMLNMKFGSQE